MKVAARYQSRGGNTKAVAEVIAKAAGVKAEPLETLNKDTVKSIAAFSTGGGMSGTNKIIKIAKTKFINVCEKNLPIKLGLRNHASLGGKGDITITDKQINLTNDFVKEIIN